MTPLAGLISETRRARSLRCECQFGVGSYWFAGFQQVSATCARYLAPSKLPVKTDRPHIFRVYIIPHSGPR